MGQSRLIYSWGSPRRGISIGDRERSFCYFQIHEPDWNTEAKRLGFGDYKTDPEHCIKMAKHIFDAAGQSFSDWTTYNTGAHLAYLR